MPDHTDALAPPEDTGAELCSCGHSAAKHDSDPDDPACWHRDGVGEPFCPCATFTPVTLPEDTGAES